MKNIEKYNLAFIETFNVKIDMLSDEFSYQAVTEWDSVGHMGLISALEDSFDIMLETEDIIDFGSYGRGKEILKKYGIEI
jgi:acyl carrier protein